MTTALAPLLPPTRLLPNRLPDRLPNRLPDEPAPAVRRLHAHQPHPPPTPLRLVRPTPDPSTARNGSGYGRSGYGSCGCGSCGSGGRRHGCAHGGGGDCGGDGCGGGGLGYGGSGLAYGGLVPSPELGELRRMLGIVLEVLSGRRPAAQIDGLVTGYDRRVLTHLRPQQWTLRSVRAQRPAIHVIELCAAVACGPRVRAVAARLEPGPTTWHFTRFHLL